MKNHYSIRTDLALETKESFDSDQVEIPGVVVDEYEMKDREIKITKVSITTENSAKVMSKPIGTYITIEAPNMSEVDESYHPEVSEELAKSIREMLPEKKRDRSVLLVGLGNELVTPDALGPYTIRNLHITRHLILEYGPFAEENHSTLISAIVPGVMAQTGMETMEILKGIINETHPDCVIAIDALAARNAKRLNRTIQIADTGIHPGSGVGNYRKGLNKETLGVPVIGIGVPTVVDAATIVHDTMEVFVSALEESDALKSISEILRSYTKAEKYELIHELIAPNLHGMFVTPKDIDETVKRLSFTISEGLNKALAEERD